MSGHSKWSKVKHQKGKTDQIKGQTFTKLGMAISIAAKEGRGLDFAIEKAKSANMPKANIERAIERGLGKNEALNLETITYEGFAPGNIAVLVETATDNRQRTFTTLKNLFLLSGGNLGNPGSVSYLFKTVGAITISNNTKSPDEYMQLAIEAGGNDIEFDKDRAVIYTDMHGLSKVKARLEEKGEVIQNAEIVFYPINRVQIEATDMAKTANLIQALEELDDVLRVTTNIA